MPLQDAEQRRDIAGDIIDHLSSRCPSTAEKHTAHADKWLGVSLVRNRLDSPRQILAEASLAADIGRGRPDGHHSPITFVHEISAQRIGKPRRVVSAIGGLALSIWASDGPGWCWTRGTKRWRASAPVTSGEGIIRFLRGYHAIDRVKEASSTMLSGSFAASLRARSPDELSI
jgi:hypothetical protein